jgi:hypothetical protein
VSEGAGSVIELGQVGQLKGAFLDVAMPDIYQGSRQSRRRRRSC